MIPPRAAPTAWKSVSFKRLLVPGVFVAYLILQIVIPVVQATGEQPARFSWQMFANRRPQPTYTVVLADGSHQPIDMLRHLGYERIELDYGDQVVPYLCRTIPDAAIVHEQAPESQHVKEIPCQ